MEALDKEQQDLFKLIESSGRIFDYLADDAFSYTIEEIEDMIKEVMLTIEEEANESKRDVLQ